MRNHLAQEVSPYLKMHSENPVDWYPWGEDALTKAKNENKPILLSIGYTACHWCHVMAHESFEDLTTAELMNKYFISIKVDREERPDLDKIYQLSAQLLTPQQGGWPLTIFLMPDSHIPFFAGTYFPKTRIGNYPSFKEVLLYVAYLFKEKKNEVAQQNISFKNILKELESQARLTSPTLNPSSISQGLLILEGEYDQENGGFGGAPKFPRVSSLEFLRISADAHRKTSNQKANEIIKHTLTKMLQGGIYDHLEGGFFRYSVDEKWQIPHFEKMLYDNALMLALMVEARSLVESEILLQAIIKTAQWMTTAMEAAEGGFFATLSADTEGKEGKFYIWKKEEIETVLSFEEYQIVSLYYGIEQAPNFGHFWHLRVSLPINAVAKKINKDEKSIEQMIETANKKLLDYRNQRPKPQRDEKIIAGWNGLAIKAMALTALATGNDEYIFCAQKAIDFIEQKLWSDNKLSSVYSDGKAIRNVSLDDYVFLIEGILYCLQTKWRTKDFNFLQALITTCLTDFEDEESGGFYYTPTNHETLIYRMKQYIDEALPASSGIFTFILQQVGYLLGEDKYLIAAEKSLKNVFPHLQRAPDAYCSFLTALKFHFNPTQIIIVRGKQEVLVIWQTVFKKYLQPNRLGFFIDSDETLPAPLNLKSPQEEEVIAYFCVGHSCLAPILDIEEFENALQSDRF